MSKKVYTCATCNAFVDWNHVLSCELVEVKDKHLVWVKK
jgi:hypothetical protein